MNITIALNQTQIENMIKDSPGYQKQAEYKKLTERQLKDEYESGYFDGITAVESHILFAGATFEYGKYVIKANDISEHSAEIQVLQDGNYAFNGTCYENKWCNIKDVSFQIDDIHIGNEASYFVYWSDK